MDGRKTETRPEKIALCGIIGHRPLRGRCPKTRPDTRPSVADGWAGAEMRIFSLFDSMVTDGPTKGAAELRSTRPQTRPDTQPPVADGWAGAEMRVFPLFNLIITY